ncbi:MAG: gliding motility-associated C-terminal domain-containing protein [Sphingobacteriales bacterium]|nr:gliding motility-associated C-terminal domain-containing protein [Sphingobacteriales bacterium]
MKKIILLWIVCYWAGNWCVAQSDCFTVNAGNDATICLGESAELNGSYSNGEILGFSWSPLAGLSNPDTLHPTVNITQTTTYTLTVEGVSGNELITNGNFNNGATGFTSDYNNIAAADSFLIVQGTYKIGVHGEQANPSWVHCFDHSSGNGSSGMMCINGSPTPNAKVWCQTVNVESNTDYAFSTWVQSLSAKNGGDTTQTNNPAILQFSINSTNLQQPFQASINTCDWQQFYATWNSGTLTSADICIVNQNTQTYGNDFAIDDISFKKLCAITDEAQVIIDTSLDGFTLGNDRTMCQNSSTSIQAPVISGATFVWQNGSSGSNFTATQGGDYWVQATTAAGCTAADTLTVTETGCCTLFIPSAFSPNNDDVNDEFKPIYACDVEDYEFKIFNRWGNQVFSTSDKNNGWDGTLNGDASAIGVYFWYVSFKAQEEGVMVEKFEKGNVTLVR